MKKSIGYLLAVIVFFSSSFIAPAFAASFKPDYCNPPQNTQIRTAIGCIDTTPQGVIQKLFTLSLGIAGGIAFLMIILGALQIQASSGNPERVNQGREIVEGAITGLLLIVFAIFILRIIGVDILAIPGFS